MGEFEPDDITRRLGVQPSEIVRAGDPFGGSQRKERNSVWTLRSRLLLSVGPVDLHVEDVLEQLDANRAEFDRLFENSAAY